MIIILKNGTPAEEITRISKELSETWKVTVEKSIGTHKVVLGLIGDTTSIDKLQVQEFSPWIEQVLRVQQPFKRVSREFRHGEASEVVVPTPHGDVYFWRTSSDCGGSCGTCSVENEAMIVETAKRVKAAGAQFLRGGAYKPRTSPYAFQGYGKAL